MNTRMRERLNWQGEFSELVTSVDASHSGRIDWDTANYLLNEGITPLAASVRYLKAKGPVQARVQPPQAGIDLYLTDAMSSLKRAHELTELSHKACIAAGESNGAAMDSGLMHSLKEVMHRIEIWQVCRTYRVAR